MTIFILSADKSKLTVRQREQITSGSVNTCQARFEFSPDWDGLTRTAVFRADRQTVSVLLDESGQCAIPWEVLTRPNTLLMAGVRGVRAGEVVLPTIWASLGAIAEGAVTGQNALPPTPDLWEQELAQKGDRLDYTETGELGLYAGSRLLASVPAGRGGEVGHGLKVENGKLSVDTVDDFQGDNTLPMTAAGVQTVVGGIEALLGVI